MEVPLEADHCPLVAANYKLAATVGLIAEFMVPTPLIVDTGAVMNLIHVQFLPKKWLATIQSYTGNKINTAYMSSVDVIGVICLFHNKTDLEVMIRLGMVRQLLTDVLVRTSFIDNVFKCIFPAERKIVPFHTRQVQIMASNQP